MKAQGKMPIKGHFKLFVKNKEGNVIDKVDIPNTITALLDAHVANLVSGGADATIGYMALGTGSGQTSSSTGLATSLARVAVDSITQGAGANDNDVIITATFPAGTATGAVTEAGVMRQNNNTSMMTYDDFAVKNIGSTDSVEIEWTITFGAS